MTDDIKRAEARGYAKGYQAGHRRAKREQSIEARRAKDNALWQRLFVAAIPAAVKAEGWKFGEKPIVNVEDRVKLAKSFADEAFAAAKREGRA